MDRGNSNEFKKMEGGGMRIGGLGTKSKKKRFSATNLGVYLG